MSDNFITICFNKNIISLCHVSKVELKSLILSVEDLQGFKNLKVNYDKRISSIQLVII
jgi:hypothetical protein